MKKVLALAALAAVGLASTNASADIIISQYYEGASFDKYIELYNTGTTAVDLAAGNYQLSHFSNAGARETWKTNGTPTATQALTGTIAAGGTYVIAHTDAAAPSYVVENQSNSTQGGVNFNGDDSSVLWTGSAFTTTSVVDAFGLTGSGFGEMSYVRNADITTGTTSDFNASQWTQYSLAAVASAASTSTERLGFHVADLDENPNVPEPTALGLLGLGGLAALRRRRA